jgi:hypothetical protein
MQSFNRLWLCLLSMGLAACAQPPVLTGLAEVSVGAAAAANAQATAPSLLTLQHAALALTDARIRAKDASVMPAFAALMRRADRALQAPLRSVIDKTRVPPSGSKNDYISMGPYWWPNPATPNGLPYVQRDGQRNPESAGNALDAERMQAMVADSRDLSLAYRFTGDVRYASKAADVIRTWFLTPATRMNPSLRFGQSVPGIAEGRGIGIIDTRDLWLVIDAVALIQPSLNATEVRGVRQWFADYAHWLDTSQLGKDESAAKNNHGIFFDVQQVAYWLFVGETERARQLIFKAQTNRFASQIDKNGLMPLELARTRPYHYHTFTLEAATRLAQYGQVLARQAPLAGQWPATDARCQPPQLHLQCPLDLWGVVIEGKSLRGVLDSVARVAVDPATWAYKTPLENTPVLAPALPVLLLAQRAYPPNTYATAVKALTPMASDHVSWLMWPTP